MFDLAWLNSIWFILVRLDLVRFRLVWFSVFGLSWFDFVRFGLIRLGWVRFRLVCFSVFC